LYSQEHLTITFEPSRAERFSNVSTDPCYLFTFSNSGLHFSHGAECGIPTSLSRFNQCLTITLTLTMTLTFELHLGSWRTITSNI